MTFDDYLLELIYLIDSELEAMDPPRLRTWGPGRRCTTARCRALLGRLRQVIEPVIGQLAVRFQCQRTWARDLWHLCMRLGRKLLSHMTAVLLNLRQGSPPLQLSLLISG